MKAACLAIMAFVAAETGYDAPPRCPEITPLDEETICAMAGYKPSMLPPGRCEVRGLYVQGHGRLYVAESEDLETPCGLSWVVHEMTHALQDYNDALHLDSDMDRFMIEQEAYQVQSNFLRFHGEERMNMHNPRACE